MHKNPGKINKKILSRMEVGLIAMLISHLCFFQSYKISVENLNFGIYKNSYLQLWEGKRARYGIK